MTPGFYGAFVLAEDAVSDEVFFSVYGAITALVVLVGWWFTPYFQRLWARGRRRTALKRLGRYRVGDEWGVRSVITHAVPGWRDVRHYVRFTQGGVDFVAFDTDAVTGLVVDTGVDVGRIWMSRETVTDRALEGLGRVDLDFESAEFSRSWRVWADERVVAYEVFYPAMIARLMDGRLTMRLLFSCIVFLYEDSEGRRILPVRAIRAMADEAAALCALLPRRMRGDAIRSPRG